MEHGVNPNLQFNLLAAGVVPVYEEHLARLERGIDLESWSKMNMDEKAMIIAVRRVTIAIKNLQTEAEIKETEAKTKKA